MAKKALFLDSYAASLLRDIVYAEYDSIASGSTVYDDNEDTKEDLREILDALDEMLED